MECDLSPYTYQFAHFNGAFNQAAFAVDHSNTWTVDLARLRHEKDILENGLANCVTYLQALRKKQARNERILNADPLPPRKKRRKVQQSKRELDREIRNRERDEQAYLNNLQACMASIYIVEGIPYTPTGFSSTLPDRTSSTTQYSYGDCEPRELSWNGWTDDAVMSPFEKQRSNPFFTNEVALDEVVQDLKHNLIAIEDGRCPPLITQDVRETGALPVPPNTATSHYRRSILSPVAAAFEPNTTRTPPELDNLRQQIDKFGISSLSSTRRIGATRRFTDIGSPHHTQPAISEERNQTWCNTTPQRSPRRDTLGEELRKRRTKSL